MTIRIVALHGVPTSPALWGRLPLAIEAPALLGLATPNDRPDWSLDSFVAEVLPLLDADTVLIGHDLGGVIAAMAALRVRVRRLVLTGTALGAYWAPVRLTARAPLHLYFYDRYGGRRFLTGGVAPARADDVLAAFPPVPDVSARMRAMAREMRPPPGLARAAAARVPVSLVWGRDDRWYPPWVARAVARGTGATITWVPGGHLCMWEAPEAYARGLEGILGR
ncbi:MAG: alpha/beta hydrolase [Pseudomonadota bacterium]|nr:alpha/beta hydrolase [Pseudomonadota bacterium]